jgi:hypothetical protein
MAACNTRNILFLGPTPAEKSQCLGLLKNSSFFFCPQNPGVTNFFLVHRSNGQSVNYTVNIIDACQTSLDTIIESCLMKEITKLHVVFVFASSERQIDRELFKQSYRLFYHENIRIAFCISWAIPGLIKPMLDELRHDSGFAFFLKQPNIEILFTSYDMRYLFKGVPPMDLRKEMLSFIFESNSDGVSLADLPISTRIERSHFFKFPLHSGEQITAEKGK